MTITEILLPVLKGDPQSISAFSSHASQISSHLVGTPGLQLFWHGAVLFDAGNPVAPDSGRAALLIEWDTLSSFHAFYPHSPAFQAFGGIMKPYAARPDAPKLFQAVTSAKDTGSAPITQIIKARHGPDTERLWTRLQTALLSDEKNSDTVGKPVFAHALGVEEQEGAFLGTIGWKDLVDYSRTRSDETVQGILGELKGGDESALDLVVRLEKVQVE
ncbi:hypothetical protein ASPCAL13697 [Aspergillus calidoustus]|uniref:ABM domain-containing protein n=1 Tax=Aspergillus calidoustus TaxID=454130 RepID=A0A0U5H8W4_ASPCI|nr:hypothetical protein ASPCAL13697 [Aspergillus calidoustus]